jgi:hypothetical protein
MTNQIKSGPMAAIAKDMQTGAKQVGRVVTAFIFATLVRLYAAYMEKAQMRLAPITIYFDRPERRGHRTPTPRR